MAETLDVSNYSGIVTISGDGLLNEIYNGLYSRDDWDSVAPVPMGLVPGEQVK